MAKHIFAVGNRERMIANKSCPECGHTGLEFYHNGGHAQFRAGEVYDTYEEWLECPVCGWSDDGMWRGLNAPEEPPMEWWEEQFKGGK